MKENIPCVFRPITYEDLCQISWKSNKRKEKTPIH